MSALTRLAFVALLSAALFGCPKHTDTNVSGTDDEQMDSFGNQLEEIKTKEGMKCQDYCGLKDKVCGISKSACDIAGRHEDRDDFQKRCVTSREDCAHFNESCGSCN